MSYSFSTEKVGSVKLQNSHHSNGTNFVLAGITTEQVLQAVDTAVAMNENGDWGIPVPDYVEENVSTKVIKLIQSYTGVVNKMVWRKY